MVEWKTCPIWDFLLMKVPIGIFRKGILQVYFKKQYASQIKIDCGCRVNVVPGEATAWVPIDAATIKPTDGIEVQADGEMTRITAVGVGGHAAHPKTPKCHADASTILGDTAFRG